MEERRADARILVASGLMFLCVLAGGLLLCLYLFQPESQSRNWYPVVGIILVATPWIFWLMVYLYHCMDLTNAQSNGYNHSSSGRTPAAHSDVVTTVTSLPEVESPACDSPAGGKRRVHFGAVVVMGNQPQKGQSSSHESHAKESRIGAVAAPSTSSS